MKSVQVLPFVEGGRDSHGNPIKSWGAPRKLTVMGWGPRGDGSSSEPRVPGREQVIVGLVLYTYPDPGITSRDRVAVNGITYEVEGEVGDWTTGPFGFEPGCTVALRRVEG